MIKTVVLAHGYMGFRTIRFAGIYFTDYFLGIEDVLTKNGYRVFIPEVHRLASISHRALSLKSQIMDYAKRHGIEKKSIYILAHSMGGLDARQALYSCQELQDLVAALVTLGTPHRGSPLANQLAKTFKPTAFIYKYSSRIFGEMISGLANLTEDFCEQFDKKITAREGINYYSIAGKINRDGANANFILKKISRLIPEENDGLVTTSSAKKDNDKWVFLGHWPVDHLGLMGWFDWKKRNTEYPLHLERYLQLMQTIS